MHAPTPTVRGWSRGLALALGLIATGACSRAGYFVDGDAGPGDAAIADAPGQDQASEADAAAADTAGSDAVSSDVFVADAGLPDAPATDAATADAAATDASIVVRDPSFGSGGIAVLARAGSEDAVSGMSLTVDGKILLSGNSTNSADGQQYGVVARLHSNGEFDDSFNGDGNGTVEAGEGWRILDYAEKRISPHGLVEQGDGRILVHGMTIDPNGSNPIAFVSRLHANGSLDDSFNGDGDGTATRGEGFITWVNGGAWLSIQDVFVNPDGSILAAGAYTDAGGSWHIMLASLLATGVLDFSYATGGVYYASHNVSDIGWFATYRRVAQDRLLVSGFGETPAGGRDFRVLRLFDNGDRDDCFNGDCDSVVTDREGSYTLSIGSFDHANDFAVQADGKIVAVGGAEFIGLTDTAVLRLDQDGQLDPSFNPSGQMLGGPGYGVIPIGVENDNAQAVTIQSDGKILIGGIGVTEDRLSRAYLLRLLPDGSPDLCFGSPVCAGTGVLLSADLKSAARMIPLGDGSLLVAGALEANGNVDIAVVKILLPD